MMPRSLLKSACHSEERQDEESVFCIFRWNFYRQHLGQLRGRSLGSDDINSNGNATPEFFGYSIENL